MAERLEQPLDPVTQAAAEAFVRVLQRRTGRAYRIVPGPAPKPDPHRNPERHGEDA